MNKLADNRCPYCDSEAIFADAQTIYGRPGFGNVWICSQYPRCEAYVGANRDGSPKGSLANTELRTWRKKAHAAFDPLWQSGKMNRTQAYQWLAIQMKIPPTLTHIAMFDIDRCQQVVKLMQKFKNETSVNL